MVDGVSSALFDHDAPTARDRAGTSDPREGRVPWWRHAVTYQVYVRSFADADGDGIGDLPGITSRLEYLRDLGVDALWLTPFYASPQADHGYDVADYCSVDPLFGRLEDADALLARAHELGLRVIVDLVPNHTSSAHPWFQAALRGDPQAAQRYLFRPGRGRRGELPPNNWGSVFGGPAWTRVTDGPLTGQWYLHLFDPEQPDLDWRNPEVPAMFLDVLRFWLDRGVDGFRVDVAHGLVKEATLRDQEGQAAQGHGDGPDHSMVERTARDEPMWDQPEVHEIYRAWHRLLASYCEADGRDRALVAEAWTQTPESLARYVRSDEMQQAFNFAWLLAPWDAAEFAEVIRGTFAALDRVGATPTWVLSNHDVVRHPSRYGGGEAGLARARAATLAMLALPGSAYLYQGEELGLEEVDVPPALRQDPAWLRNGESRDGCRVPIPWGGTEPPFGFGPSEGQPWLPQPASWTSLTVSAQTGAEGSTLEFYRAALDARRKHTADLGARVELDEPADGVLTFRRGRLTVVLNAGRDATELPAGEVLIASGELEGHLLPPDTAAWVIA